MQYLLDMTVNTKIPDDLAHELAVERFRNKFQCIEWLWFNFKIYGISNELLVVSSTPFWRLTWEEQSARLLQLFFFIVPTRFVNKIKSDSPNNPMQQPNNSGTRKSVIILSFSTWEFKIKMSRKKQQHILQIVRD